MHVWRYTWVTSQFLIPRILGMELGLLRLAQEVLLPAESCHQPKIFTSLLMPFRSYLSLLLYSNHNRAAWLYKGETTVRKAPWRLVLFVDLLGLIWK